MAQIPENPLLRLDKPRPDVRRIGHPGFAPSRDFTRRQQRRGAIGQRFARLGTVFDEERDPLDLRYDPTGLAPERLVVFELTGDVSGFAKAAARVPGLEFVGSEDLASGDEDKNPVLYLLIPDATALKQMLSLWRMWVAQEDLPRGFAPWKSVFAHLRDLRVWGPQDRVTAEDLVVFAHEQADSDGMVRLEIELVFRKSGEATETAAIAAVTTVGGTVLSRVRIDGAGYHALLVKIPAAELVRVGNRSAESLAGEESIMHIRPQSVLQVMVTEADNPQPPAASPAPKGNPITAVFDAVPLAGHPQLQGRLALDDPFGLEALAVGNRLHGTAMASAVIHGDLNTQQAALSRPIYFLNVMYAPASIQEGEKFPDKLPADLFQQALAHMKDGDDPASPDIIIINASLGDANKPFVGRISGWARVLDYLSHKYGVLFVVSAGNQMGDLPTDGVTTIQFEAMTPQERARSVLRSSSAAMASRRILSPSESMNSLTIGSLHSDQHPVPQALPASIFDVWADTGLCNVSSALGPGYGGSTKPDLLSPGGRHHVRLFATPSGHRLNPLGIGAPAHGGIKVASPAPPAAADPNATVKSVGTSVAAALTTGLAGRAHEILEEVYEDFLEIPGISRALLLKALLVHCARWTKARDVILEIVGPPDAKQHVRQKDNIRRYLGYGALDPQIVLGCTADRATLWATSSLGKDAADRFTVPLPLSISGKAQPHELSATVAWFAPPLVGRSQYRGARLKLLEPAELKDLAVSPTGLQPDSNQSHSGTVIHRRWTGEKAAAFGTNAALELMIQRQPDDLDEQIPYAIVTTLAMPGVAEVYAQVRARVAVKPRVQIAVT